MGSNTSKPNSDAAVKALKNDLDIGANSDPRSPTPEITRTPLQMSEPHILAKLREWCFKDFEKEYLQLSQKRGFTKGKTGPKHNITKNADLRKTFENSGVEEKLIHNNPILSAVIKNHLQSYDPRSPTQDFERTPIIIASKIDELTEDRNMINIQDGNSGSPCLKKDEDTYDSCAEANESPDLLVPKNLCNGFYDLTLNETIKDTEEPLGSSTASNEAIENNISAQSVDKPQLLETNFDSEEIVTEVKQNVEEFLNLPLFKILDEDPRSPSAGIERTPLVVAKLPADTSEENVEEMSDDSLIKVLQDANEDLRKFVTKPKNEGVLIYEDDLHDTPKKSKSDCSSDSRTPLSCMKNKADAVHMRSKSANTLDDAKGHKLLAKGRRVSHIPRLKSLSKQSKLLSAGSTVSLKSISKKSVVSGDCENTPPHSHRDKWDKDNSIVL